jgi:hypothetical protein
MNKDEIIEKIKKLLRMKRGGTPAEVETALNMARELAAKHNIDIEGVNPDEESHREQPIGHEDALLAARIQWECKYAGLITQNFFNVQMLLRRTVARRNGWPVPVYAITFIGTEWDRQIGVYVFEFLCGHFRREWTRRRGRCRNRQAFLYGMYIGLGAKLKEQRDRNTPSGPGLVRLERAVERRKLYMEQTFGATTTQDSTPDSDAEAAKYAGYLAGRDTEIRSGVKDAATAAAERLGTNAQGALLLN